MTLRTFYFWLGITAFTSVIVACATPKSTVKKMKFESNIVIAHRGAFKKNGFPENSIASLREAIRLRCTGSEFDVRMTADEVLVISHDAAHGGLEIEQHTYEELQKFPLKNGEILPTLQSYLEAGKKRNQGTRLVLEIKPSPSGPERGAYIAEKVYKMVADRKAANWVEYISFDYGILKKLVTLDATVPTHYLNGDRSPADVKADGIRGIDYNFSVFKKNPAWITLAKELGVVLNVWTVNEPEPLQWCIEQGFDFITTNEPEYLLLAVKAH
jgi:glycerophosphoryl diester phosphodiesterase